MSMAAPLPPAMDEVQVIAEGSQEALRSAVEQPVAASFANEESTEQITAQQVFETLATQYLDTLYLSRTSLAYFAKGPLSRARAAFQSGDHVDLLLTELTQFLRTMLLSQRLLDSKYREKITEVIHTLPPASASDTNGKKLQRKSRKAKRLKPGKDGLYPSESEHIQKWWHSSEASLPSKHSDGAALLRQRVAELRTRETLAQLIIALEALAIEALPTHQELTVKPREEAEIPQDTAIMDMVDQKKRKAKAPQNLAVLVDLLVDKLCIWQSLEQDDIPLENSEGMGNGAVPGKDTKASSSDVLSGFCVEVIVPL